MSSSSQPDQVAIFCREVRNLLRSKPNCMIAFSKFVPAYHNHYGRQCCVYQFGYTKLIELLESIPHVVQIIGCDSASDKSTTSATGRLSGANSNSNTSTTSPTSSTSNGANINQRYITLTYREQIKRFASDLIKVVKSQPGKRLKLSQFAHAYEQVLGRTFRVLDYGTNNINVLLAEIWEGTINIIPIKREHCEPKVRDKAALFVNVPLQANPAKPVNPVLAQLVASHELVNKPYITQQYPDCWFEIPKRERSEREIKRTKYFVWDVIELLSKMKPQHSVPFSKFIPAYHYYFNRQCKVSIFGFSKLIDLFESISPEVVDIIDQGPGEDKIIRLAKRHWPAHSGASNSISVRGARAVISRHRLQQQQQQQQQLGHYGKLSVANSPEQSVGSSDDELDDEDEEEEDEDEDDEEEEDQDQEQEGRQELGDERAKTHTRSSRTREAIDCGPTEQEMMELEDELEAYEQLEAIRNRRSARMAAILDIFKYSIY